MKTTIIRHFLLVGVASLVGLTSRSQINSTNEIAYTRQSTDMVNTASMKIDLSSLRNYISDDKVNRKILKYFVRHFENAGNIEWAKVDDNVLAEFVSGEITTRALFNKSGHLIYTIRVSNEQMLPRNYLEMVHNLYTDYKIGQVARVNEASREIWVVKLAAPDKLITMRIENDQPEEVERFERAR